MNGIKVNVNNQNGGQHDDYMSILSNNNYLLDFEHISNDVFEANIKPCLKQLRCVINELIDSESVYVKSLCDIEEGYLLRLKGNEIGVNSQLLDVLFYKIPDLRVFHAQLHTDLQLSRDNLIQLGQVFLDNAKQFEELYVEFCLNYPKSIHLLEEEQKSRTEVWTYLINCQLELQHQLPLATYLLKPVQRVLKYQLLLQECLRHLNQLVTELSKHHSSGEKASALNKTRCNLESSSENTNNNNNGCNNSDDVDYLDFLNESVFTLRQALERMIQVADHINERKRYREFLDQLRSTRLDVDNWGDIVLCDYFRIPGKKDLRLVLLFQCALILCKYTQPSGNIHVSSTQSLSVNDNWISNTMTTTTTTTTTATMTTSTGPRNSLDRVGPGNSSLWNLNVRSIEIREVISCANLMLVECIDKDPLAFHILPFDNPKAQRTLQAISLETKRLWCREIKRLILENYDAAIPERAKQIVLNMAELTYGPPIKDISDLPMSLTNLQKVGTFYAGQQRNGLMMNEERSASGRVHRKSDTALPRLRRLVNRSISSTNAPLASNFIRTPNPSLDEDTVEARIPSVTNRCMLNGNSKHNSRDSLSFDNGNNSTERHLDSLLHEAWEEIWAKHHSPVKPNGSISTSGAGVVVSPAVNGQLNPLRNTHHHNSKGGGEKAEDDSRCLPGGDDGTLTTNTTTVNEADFRCIAVEINEERFGLSSPSSTQSITSNCTVSETRKCSVPSLSKLSNTSSTNHFINHSDNSKFSVPTSPSSQPLSHCSSSPSFPVCHKSSLTSNSIQTSNGITPSVYIDCPNASSYDVITFGRTYEQYIAKARAMVALSPRDLDEIFSPLRELACIVDSENNLSPTTGRHHCPLNDEIALDDVRNTLAHHRCATVPLTMTTNLSHTKQRCATSTSITKNLSRLTQGLKISLTDLSSHAEHAENDTLSDGDRSNGHCSSGGSSPRHIVSRIAVTHNRNTFSNDLITKTITVIPNSIPDPSFRTTATTTTTIQFHTSGDSKNNFNTVSDAHNGRRCSRQGSFERADSCHNGTKSSSGSPKQLKPQLIGINNGLSNKSSVSKPPRLTNHHSTLTSVGNPVKATYNNSVDRKQTTHDSSCSTPTSPIVYDLNGRRSRRKSRAPAPPIPLGDTRPPLPHPPLKAPLAVLEGGDDVCVEPVCSGHVKAVISSLSEISTKPNGLFKANSLHLKDRTTTASTDDDNNTNKGKPIKPPRRLNSTSSSSDIPRTFIKEKTAPSRNYSPTLRSLHNPSLSHNKTTATSHDVANQRLGIVKNMINKFQQP
ncbi:unnamed protein product [Trichobilharzia szidati]|nr:unnamed protein product [Trichobilharzia szidati]